jgi:hypothetical protein
MDYINDILFWEIGNRSQDYKVRWASNYVNVRVYRVPQMQGVGHADVTLWFKCPTTKQMRCPLKAYENLRKPSLDGLRFTPL